MIWCGSGSTTDVWIASQRVEQVRGWPVGVSLLGRSPIPCHRLAVVALNATTGLVPPAKLRLRIRGTPLGQHPELREVELADVHVGNVGRRGLDRHRFHRRRPLR